MREWIDTRPEVNVQEREYLRLLGFPEGYELQGRLRELADQARAWYRDFGRPWLVLRTLSGFTLTDGHAAIEGEALSSPALYQQLTRSRAEDVVLAAVSAGKECEEHAKVLWNQGKPDEYFFLEVFGSAVVEHLMAQAAFLLCDWGDGEGKAILPHYSPGYPGWEITDQRRLLAALTRSGDAPLPGGLHVMESGMLVPRKSLLALFGVAPQNGAIRRLTDMTPCERCSLARCQYRRTPYRRPLPQSEDVRRLRPSGASTSWPDDGSKHAIRYSVGISTLAKWCKERLAIERHSDGSVQARFRYSGTTCADMGRPLEFDYHVLVGPQEEGFTILSAECLPAPEDTGHVYMCRHRDDGGSFVEEIRREKPLLGKRLQEVFQWDRPFAPSGCYCESKSRDHKWGLVLEVLHYALATTQENAGTESN